LKSVGLEQRYIISRARYRSANSSAWPSPAPWLTPAPWWLADEPTGSLDSKNGAAVLELLRRICAEGKNSLLLVTHDPQVMKGFEKIVRLEDLR